METPWKVIGFERWTSERGDECVRLYVVRPLVLADGSTGEGFETQRLFYKPMYVDYKPVVNHLIIPMEGYNGRISKIIVVGTDAPRQGA